VMGLGEGGPRGGDATRAAGGGGVADAGARCEQG